MYVIIEEHIDVNTGSIKEVTPVSSSREEYQTYEECVERIEKFLVPHSIDLGVFEDEINYNRGTEVDCAFGRPIKWKVLRSAWYHTVFTIKKV